MQNHVVLDPFTPLNYKNIQLQSACFYSQSCSHQEGETLCLYTHA